MSAAALSMLLPMLALADASDGAPPEIRVQHYEGAATDRASRGQTFATALTPTTIAEPPPQMDLTSARRVPPPSTPVPVTDVPVTDAPVVESSPTTAALPPLALSLEGAVTIDNAQIKTRPYQLSSKRAPLITWQAEAATTVTMSGPGASSDTKSGSIVPCPGMLDGTKCKPERGTYEYVLRATDEWGREVTSTVVLMVGRDEWASAD